jgi:hypothetical protein
LIPRNKKKSETKKMKRKEIVAMLGDKKRWQSIVKQVREQYADWSDGLVLELSIDIDAQRIARKVHGIGARNVACRARCSQSSAREQLCAMLMSQRCKVTDAVRANLSILPRFSAVPFSTSSSSSLATIRCAQCGANAREVEEALTLVAPPIASALLFSWPRCARACCSPSAPRHRIAAWHSCLPSTSRSIAELRRSQPFNVRNASSLLTDKNLFQ